MIHFVGIGGIGMSAIARVLLARGESVSGSDLHETPLIEALRREGATVMIGHRAENVEGAQCVVISSAVHEDNPELVAARAAGKRIVRRGAMLAELMRGHRGIAIAGTHGKTTTTAMVAAILKEAQVDATVLIGGALVGSGTNARFGGSDWLLTEADESDGSFVELEPTIAVVTNIENDHISSDSEIPKLQRSFELFLEKLPRVGTAIIGIDTPAAASLAQSLSEKNVLTFGLRRGDVHAANIQFSELGSQFEVAANGRMLGTIRLRVPGEINIENALAAFCVGYSLQLQFARIAKGLEAFSGVHRRFDILTRNPRMMVVDDYAHHPTAIRATIAAARGLAPKSLIVAFQPHRYTRTAYLAKEFAAALQGADCVYLAPVYAASEAPMEGVSERSIGEPLAATGADVRYVEDVRALPEILLREAPDGAMVLMLGAGNISSVAATLAAELRGAPVG